ncbi:MAG TPA: GIY-YIG nuclease family protein [Massilibacterium sp.]|nr:GIY-YIG nuclease family protein [Massilibacterium sp.]
MSRYDSKHYVYEIKFPDKMRYIGCTYNVSQRMRTHATNPNKSLKSYLLKSGYSFTDAKLSVLEIADDKTEGHRIEKNYFCKFYEEGLLVNKYTPKKERHIVSVEMPDGKKQKVDIIKDNIFNPKEEN